MDVEEGKRPLLYFYHAKTSFTEIDETIFCHYRPVRAFAFGIKRIWDIPILLLKQLIFLLKNAGGSHCMVCMFAGYHSLLPVLVGRLIGKQVFIVAGGIDCVNFPLINYGNRRKKLLSIFTGFSFRNAAGIFPISEYLVHGKYTYDTKHPSEQGILAWYPRVNTPIEVIYNGFECDKWYPPGNMPPEKTFLTIASNLDDTTRMSIKGIDLIVETAIKMPDCLFTIIGKNQPGITANWPPNIKVLPQMAHEDLRAEYGKNRFYLQLSVSEGFGNALAEAMLCGCVPIGSSAGSIPMVIGDCGYILAQRDSSLLKKLLQAAISEKNFSNKSKCARKRVLENFSIEKRQQKLAEKMIL